MKLLILLLLSLLDQDNVLVEQGGLNVELSDLDAYVYLLPADKRYEFSNDEQQIEKNIITILNMNIVYDYVKNSELQNKPMFNQITQLINETPIEPDAYFHEKLALEDGAMHEHVKGFILKKEYYRRLLEYIKNEFSEGKLDQLAKESFLVNSKSWKKPEERELSMIQIDPDSEHYDDSKELLLSLLSDQSYEKFVQSALEYSDDPSVQINKGNLATYRRDNFKMPFVDQVFSAPTGVIPSLFKHNNSFYIVRVNEIIAGEEPVFEDYEDEIKAKLLDELVDQKFQSIINTKATNKIDVNAELMAHVFERYKVFKED